MMIPHPPIGTTQAMTDKPWKLAETNYGDVKQREFEVATSIPAAKPTRMATSNAPPPKINEIGIAAPSSSCTEVP